MGLILPAGPARSAWYGDLGIANERDASSLAFLYDVSERSLVPEDGGSARDLSAHRFAVQYARGFGQGFEGLLRVTPVTGRINLEGSALNPEVWGVGGGIHWAPPEPLGPVRVGFQATVDYQEGRESSANKIQWLELGLAGGLTVPLGRGFHASGGVTFIKPDVQFEAGGVESDWEEEEDFGGYAGLSWSSGTAWSIGAEGYFKNERGLGLTARYNFY